MRSDQRTSFHVGESCPFAEGPAVIPISRGQRQRAEKLGWRFTSLDAALSAARQVEHIDELVRLGVDAVTAFTLDAALVEPAYARAAAKIPIITFGSESPSAAAVIRQQVDSRSCAIDAVAYLAGQKPGARALVVGGPPIPALVARADHFLEAAACAGLQIVGRADNIGDVEETGRPIVRRLLDQHPDIDAIWCFNDYTALAAAAELQRRGMPVHSGDRPGVIVVGIGGFPAMIEAIRERQATITYDSQPVEAGRAAIGALEAIFLRGEKPPREVPIGFRRFDLTNVNEYVPWSER